MSGGRSGSRARQRARQLLVQALYQWQIGGDDIRELTRQFATVPDFARADQEYFEQMLAICVANAEDFDKTITRFAARSIEQLDVVGRAILLLALAELGHRPDVPTGVVINEAVELAKRFGATDSFRFVNALLDKASKLDGSHGGRAASAQVRGD
jgi:transcription antitermination protein NusB